MIRRGVTATIVCGLTGLFLLLSGSAADPKAERLAKLRVLGKAFYENPTTQAQAVEQFKQAWELNPGDAVDRMNYGLALLRNGQTAAGIAELEAVQKADASIPHTWFNLGIEYKRQGETAKAIQQLERMGQLRPGEAITHYNLGALYKNEGRIEQANAKFELAAKLDPNLAAPHFQLFNYYRQNGKPEEAKSALARFQALKKKHEEAGTGNEDIEWSFYSEVLDRLEPVSASDSGPGAGLKFRTVEVINGIDPPTARLAVADFDADGTPDLLLSSKNGLRIFRRGKDETAQPEFGAVKGVEFAEPGDFDNDGYPDLITGSSGRVQLWRNVKGSFKAAAINAPNGSYNAALWIDYDHDYDLDLLLLGSKSVLLRNQAESGFEDRSADLPLVKGNAAGAVNLRLIPDTKSHDFVVTYVDRPAVLYHDRLGGKFDVVDLSMIPVGAQGLASEDLDNDGQLDLMWVGGAAYNRDGKFTAGGWPVSSPFTVGDFENRGMADLFTGDRVLRAQGKGIWNQTDSVGLPGGMMHAVTADFDGDGRADAASVLASGALKLSYNETPLKNLWTRVKLTGVKNLKLATGAEVEVRAGTFYQKRVYRGVPLTFGVRSAALLDTIRITWPNGLIQNETNQKARQPLSYQEAQRLSGSCPIIWTWNGREFEYITDVLGVAPLGAAAGDGTYFPTDHDEFIWIGADSLRARDGHYEVRITEELSEVTYLDQVELIAVDHPVSVSVFTNEKWKSPPFPDFRLYGAERRVYPIAARGAGGRDELRSVLRKDRIYTGGFKRDYQGVAEMHAVEFDFGAAARDGRAVLVLDGWVDWADGSTFLARAQTRTNGLQTPRLEVKDESGAWVTALEDMGMPAGKPKVIAVDLTGLWKSKARQVRIVTNLCVFWDEVFLLETDAAPEVRLTALRARISDLRFRGFAEHRVHPLRLHPEEFIYGEGKPVSAWNPTPGMYTRYGEVSNLLDEIDDRMVIMGSGDEVSLRFDASRLPALKPGWRRDFILKVDGWAKDRDANTAYSQTVEPLPFHGMSAYPYPAEERFPDTPAHREWRERYNTRPALRLLQSLNGGRGR